MLIRCDKNTTADRSGFSLIEMTIVATILAIGSAVVLPRWSQSVDRSKVLGMRRSVEADIDLLRRASVRRSQSLNLTLGVNSGQLIIAPPVPDVLGDAYGVVNYSDRFPGVSFSAADLNGNASCDLNMYGELVSTVTGQPLSAGLITVASNSTTQTSDLLAFQGATSTPTPPGGEETAAPAQSLTAPPVSDTTTAATSVPTDTTSPTQTTSSKGSSGSKTTSTSSGKSSLLKSLGL